MPGSSSPSPAQPLPQDRSFQALLAPYLAPYLAYVALSSIPASWIAPTIAQAIKLPATAALLLWFRRQYCFGPFRFFHAVAAILALPLALAAWIGPFYLLDTLGVSAIPEPSVKVYSANAYFYLRLFNSTILVAFFEELSIRVYMMGWLYQADLQRHEKGTLTSILDTLNQHPSPLATLPLSAFSVIGTTIVFAAGHSAREYLSAACYFLFTTWLYRKTGSLWACILVHGLVNLVIAVLVGYAGMGWLW
jgi:hypothetical protein